MPCKKNRGVPLLDRVQRSYTVFPFAKLHTLLDNHPGHFNLPVQGDKFKNLELMGIKTASSKYQM